MSKAKITKQDGYRCAPEGHTVILFPAGSIVTGKVAEWALDDRAASRMFDAPETKVTPPTETKAKRKPRAKK